MRGRAAWLVGACLATALAVAGVRAAELQGRTLEAYVAYASVAQRLFLDRLTADSPRFPQARMGDIVAGPGDADGILNVPGGLLHHWIGTAFVPGVTLDQVLAQSQDYPRYPALYESVRAARVLERTGDSFRLLLRLEEHSGPVSATLDVTSEVEFVHLGPDAAYSVSRSLEIRQVENPGAADERHRPVGNDSGYLWRANTFTRYLARDGGVYMELETLGLSRGYPPLLGWIIEPIARRLGRKSVAGSLEEFRLGLLDAPGRAPRD